jgi:predicted MPP superfamily phosphohydrolase
MSETLRIAVLSDLHADATSNDDTYIVASPPNPLPGFHPLTDLVSYVRLPNQVEDVDIVLCPGDLANKSSTLGKQYGWNQLQVIAKELAADHLIASPGNHDVETRTYTADPAADLKALNPSFPTTDSTQDAAFWRQGYAFIEGDNFRILNINSCHGFPTHPGPNATDDVMNQYLQLLNRGTFPESMEAELHKELRTKDEKSVNILLCHHHPVEHQLVASFQDWYGPMNRGADLIRMLDAYPAVGRWIVVHGHKHVPLLTTTGFSANSPVIFCSASVGGRLWHPVVTVTRNQFHVVEFELDANPDLPNLRGTIESHVWGFGRGWYRPNRDGGLPAECGFGPQHDHRLLAQHVVHLLTSRALEFCHWTTVLDAVPQLRYQGPRDLEMFEQALDRDGWILFRDNRTQKIIQIAKRMSA